ncbi:MAG: response regulator transcription factor [Faecalicatena sp.]|uniref:response regulator transcription factor n=1 Tax=Faecalicatena sp. TaxID=2005360 RepID=UPI00258A512E|nr:response regulator transcription factor [Faecalicatena sp.]MCI6464116.1 response regulator transcription factor [Faecalicatena sp.]MDY5616966.1 response regulator transcription factor [Lachnospiraceae bacterium]
MRILIIEDDEQLLEALKLQLEHNGFQTDCITDGADAVYYALHNIYDVIILDRMLPGMDGLTILKLLRENQIHTPVLLATAVDSISDRIEGLDCGADDYIVKPYDVGELLARIRALVRRPVSLGHTDQMTYGDLTFQPESHILRSGQTEIQLSRREALLMEYFLKNPGQTLTRQLIYTRVWGPDSEVEDGNLDTYVYYLRKHLRKLNSGIKIATVHGLGYRLEKET